VLVVSLDNRNLSNNASSILIVPFGSYGEAGPTTISLPPGETGLPETSYLKAHFIQVLQKRNLLDPQRRMLSSTRIRQVVDMIRRSVDPDAQWAGK
jgi:mRNA-degrading endonuclease toxin of MazEF toxin-antitoxin module